ncbi:motility associated factor glycosyltransferase family protein [Shewanella sp. BJSY2023SW005]|uniref:motility associated factor glycosyltransferase family protein n=1 Tax=Shewanella sp. BJSY2023SW005 TaxID=3392043 RepID=UPI0039B4A3E1
MTELFAANLQIIQSRWPIVASALKHASFEYLDACLVTAQNQTISVNGIQLSSRYDRLAEARLLITQLPEHCKEVTVYGIGMGDVPSLLIDKPQFSKIMVCPLNIDLFALLLSYTDQSEWLLDQRVTLVHRLEPNKLAQDYIAITPDLLLIKDENAKLRDLLVLENNRKYANKHHGIDNPEIRQRLDENLTFIEQDPDAAALRMTHSQPQAHIIGAGPSLEEHYPYLLQQQSQPLKQLPLMIAVDTAVRALFAQGIVPDIVVSIDSKITLAHFPEDLPNNLTLVYFPTLSSEVITAWPGPRFMAYSSSPIYDELNRKHPKLRLYTNGSVIHPAIDLAVHLGIREIILFGCDFCYPNNKTHAHWQEGLLGPSTQLDKKHWVINGHGERVATDLNFRAYLRNLEHYICANPNVKFYQSSLESARISGAQYKEVK